MTITATIHKIAAELSALATESDTHGEDIEGFALKVIARRLDAQAEMLEYEARP